MGLRQFLLSTPILIAYLLVAIFNKLKIDSLKRLFKSIGEKLTYMAFKK